MKRSAVVCIPHAYRVQTKLNFIVQQVGNIASWAIIKMALLSWIIKLSKLLWSNLRLVQGIMFTKQIRSDTNK